MTPNSTSPRFICLFANVRGLSDSVVWWLTYPLFRLFIHSLGNFFAGSPSIGRFIFSTFLKFVSFGKIFANVTASNSEEGNREAGIISELASWSIFSIYVIDVSIVSNIIYSKGNYTYWLITFKYYHRNGCINMCGTFPEAEGWFFSLFLYNFIYFLLRFFSITLTALSCLSQLRPAFGKLNSYF